ncbi:hypothetical protein GWK47_047245 [Chionoecetes opilio]|uniref:Uncharacterized protein n=1 Tax=Chionoecetes opilio TaxID=41210 RepID=A0A8J4YBC8_CHIOP|nr:hypothetical protein GWK47_047245 [Chionoecetes opilio]
MSTSSSPDHPDEPGTQTGSKEKFLETILQWYEGTASHYNILTQDNWNDSVKKTPVHRAEKLTKRPLRGIAAKAKVPQRRDDGPTPLLLATAETGNFGDAACPPMPPLDPLVISLIKSGKHQEEVNHLIQEVTEAYKAKKAAWQAMEKYYRDLNK